MILIDLKRGTPSFKNPDSDLLPPHHIKWTRALKNLVIISGMALAFSSMGGLIGIVLVTLFDKLRGER